jgi:hypothetical protein
MPGIFVSAQMSSKNECTGIDFMYSCCCLVSLEKTNKKPTYEQQSRIVLGNDCAFPDLDFDSFIPTLFECHNFVCFFSSFAGFVYKRHLPFFFFFVCISFIHLYFLVGVCELEP